MDTTVTQLGEVVIAALRAANYMESTIGNYQKSINALTRFVAARGGVYTPALGARPRPFEWWKFTSPVQRPVTVV